MDQSILEDFGALSPRAKIAVLARSIHMETIHVRSAHLDDPENSEAIYRSSEFVHRLSGFIMSLTYNPEEFEQRSENAAQFLLDGIASHGRAYLGELHKWIVDARSIA